MPELWDVFLRGYAMGFLTALPVLGGGCLYCVRRLHRRLVEMGLMHPDALWWGRPAPGTREAEQ